MKRKINVEIEIEVLDDEHCSKKCHYLTHLTGDIKFPVYCTIEPSQYWREMKKDNIGFLRTNKCRQAEICK